MYCHKCGYELIDGAIYCSKCGAKIQVDTHVDNDKSKLELLKHSEPIMSKYSERIASTAKKGSKIVTYFSFICLGLFVFTFVSKVLFAQPIMLYLREDLMYSVYAAIIVYFVLKYVKIIKANQNKRIILSLIMFLGGLIAGIEGLGFTFTLILLYLLYLYKK